MFDLDDGSYEDEEAQIRHGEIEFVKHCGVALVKQVEELKLESTTLREENEDLRRQIYDSPVGNPVILNGHRTNEGPRSNSGILAMGGMSAAHFQNYAPSVVQSDSGTCLSVYSNQTSSMSNAAIPVLNHFGTIGAGTGLGFVPGMSGGAGFFNQLYQTIISPNDDSIEAHQSRQESLLTELESLRKISGLEKKPPPSSECTSPALSLVPESSTIRKQSGNSRQSSAASIHELASQAPPNGSPPLNSQHATQTHMANSWNRFRAAQQCVNNLETELENARQEYRNNMADFSQRLKSEARKMGTCVEKGRPLFDAQRNMRRAQAEVQQVSMQYRRAQHLKDVAKQMVTSAEQKMGQCKKIEAGGKDVGLLMQWLEQLNHSNDSFTKASETANQLAKSHGKAAKEFVNWQGKVHELENSNVAKYLDQAKPYFNLQSELWGRMEQQGAIMVRIEASLAEARAQFSAAVQSIHIANSSSGSSERTNSIDQSPQADRFRRASQRGTPDQQTSPASRRGLPAKTADALSYGADAETSETDEDESRRGHGNPDPSLAEIIKPSALFPDEMPTSPRTAGSFKLSPRIGSPLPTKATAIARQSSNNRVGSPKSDSDMTQILSSIGFYKENKISASPQQYSSAKVGELLGHKSTPHKSYSLVHLDGQPESDEESIASRQSKTQQFADNNESEGWEFDF